MIKILEGFADNVIAVAAIGHVTREDYETVLIPQVEATARRHPKIRCDYEVDADFTGAAPGAVWKDFRVGVDYWMRWERIVLVTDVAWLAHMMNAFRFLLPGQLRVYTTSEKDAARAWIETS